MSLLDIHPLYGPLAGTRRPLAHMLYYHRVNQNLSQKQVASQIGVSRRVYSNYENGSHGVPLPALIALADLYKISLDQLVDREIPL